MRTSRTCGAIMGSGLKGLDVSVCKCGCAVHGARCRVWIFLDRISHAIGTGLRLLPGAGCSRGWAAPVPLPIDPLPLVCAPRRPNLLHSHETALEGPERDGCIRSVPPKPLARQYSAPQAARVWENVARVPPLPAQLVASRRREGPLPRLFAVPGPEVEVLGIRDAGFGLRASRARGFGLRVSNF